MPMDALCWHKTPELFSLIINKIYYKSIDKITKVQELLEKNSSEPNIINLSSKILLVMK